MNAHERQHRLALSLLLTGIILIFLLMTHLLIGSTVLVLYRIGVLSLPASLIPSPVRAVIVFVLFGLIAGALVSLLFVKLPLRPLNRLINQMNRLAAGDFKARIDFGDLLGRHPSFAELTESFNRMAEELQNTEMLRTDFINNFSHEFKTPIVSIAGFAKLLRRGNLSAAQQEEYLSIIEEESLRLSQMATNVLSLTKVENQAILTDTSTYNLSEQLRSCILLLSDKWEKKEIEFLLDFDEHDIHANEELLKQVWINLLDNAIKFSPPGETIELRIENASDMRVVSVQNKGPEIPPAQQKKIFNKFYQADESHAAMGNGVGLAIVKAVTELHNGEVSVYSKNGVTKFYVALPWEQT